MSDLAIRTAGLTKRFASGQIAVNEVDLLVPAGAVYGFLGPNGSGKTTTIRMLLGLVRPTAGSIQVLGQSMPEAAAAVLGPVGALVEGPAFQPYLSGRANLQRLDACDPSANPRTRTARTEQALERVGLTAAAAKKYRQYSLGMKQRLGLAAALLRRRELMILDEPTNGLDPQGTREIRNLIRELAQAGTTVLVSSHLLSEIDQVCTHVGIMSKGRLITQSERDVFKKSAVHQVEVLTTAPTLALRVLDELGLSAPAVADSALALTELAATATLVSAGLNDLDPAKVSAALVGAGVDLLGFAVTQPTLEQLFVELTGEGFDVAR